ncbi:thiamine pyrophosphate-binding protein [Pseudomonas sp. LB3P38]|uniref:thiamine pyrophosphate-binding protein n=1 Tax=Pseudomonas lyxosi TaxID=3398358 RepID=UPI0039F0326A
MALQSLGERIADLLVAEGIDKFFSLPEVTFGKLHHALHDRGVPLIAPHHETASGFMAEAYAAFTGNISVVGANCGPGVINLYSAIANSWEEHLPVLYIGSERTSLARNSPRRSKFQCPPSIEVVRPMTKFAAVLENPMEADELFHEAFRQLRSGTPGPVYIGLPFDMLLEDRDFGELVPPQQYRPTTFEETVSDAQIERVASMLVQAKSPLLVGGTGIRNSGSQALFDELVLALQAPVILTASGRGVLADTHPYVFDLGLEPGASISRDADVIFAIGTPIGEKLGFGGYAYSNEQKGFPNYFGKHGTQRWIQLDLDPHNIGRNRPVEVGLAGDMRQILPRLIAALRRHQPLQHNAQVERWQAERQSRYADFCAQVATISSTPIHPGRAVLEVQKTLPEDVVLIRDGGAFSIWMHNYIQHSLGGFMFAGKLGNLGTGLPYALGASLAEANADKRVCLITGDGAFGFYPMEFETAVRYQLPIVIVVGYDQGWSLEVPYYMHVCGRTFEVDHAFVRLDDMARAMGGHGEFCETSEQIAPAMERAFASGKPAIVQVVIDREVNAYQMPNTHLWTRWHADKAVYSDE